MAETIPPVPFKSPVTDKSGMMTPVWYTFFRVLFNHVGGSTPDQTDTLASQVKTLQTEVSTLEGLGVGRQL